MTAIREKLVQSLTSFFSNYRELEDVAYKDVKDSDDSEQAVAASNEAYDKVVGELQQSLTTVLEREPYSTEEIAGAMSCLIEALEEIDPDLFEELDEEDDDDEDEEDDDEFDLDDDEEEDDSEADKRG